MLKKDAQLEAMASVSLFQDLSKADLRRILKETKEEQYSPGKTIISEGDQGGRFFLLLEGLASVSRNSRKLRTLGPGDFFGEMSLLDSEPRSATVKAETNIKALSLASWNFLALLEEKFSISRKVMAQLSRRIREFDRSTV